METEYKKLDNNQIMICYKDGIKIIEHAWGMYNQIKIIETEDSIIYKWTIFDFDINDWIDDIENETEIIVDGQNYQPVDGKIEIFF